MERATNIQQGSMHILHWFRIEETDLHEIQ